MILRERKATEQAHQEIGTNLYRRANGNTPEETAKRAGKVVEHNIDRLARRSMAISGENKLDGAAVKITAAKQ